MQNKRLLFFLYFSYCTMAQGSMLSLPDSTVLFSFSEKKTSTYLPVHGYVLWEWENTLAYMSVEFMSRHILRNNCEKVFSWWYTVIHTVRLPQNNVRLHTLSVLLCDLWDPLSPWLPLLLRLNPYCTTLVLTPIHLDRPFLSGLPVLAIACRCM